MRSSKIFFVLAGFWWFGCGAIVDPDFPADSKDLPPILGADVRGSVSEAPTSGPETSEIVASFASDGGMYAYVTNSGANTVSVIDQTTLAVTNEIPVGERPVGIWPAPDGSTVYVANQVGGTVSRIDVATQAVTVTVPVGTRPTPITGSPNGSVLYVGVEGPASGIVVLDALTLTSSAFIPTDSFPADLEISHDGTLLFAPTFYERTAHKISTASNSVLQTLSVGADPLAAKLTPDESKLWVVAFADDEVAVLDPVGSSVLNTIGGFVLPLDVAFNEAGSVAYVTGNDLGGTELFVVDAALEVITGTIDVGAIPTTATRSPNDGSIWVVNFFSDNIAIVDPTSNTVSATIGVSAAPLFVAFVPPSPLERVRQAFDTVQALQDSGSLSRMQAFRLRLRLTIIENRVEADDTDGAVRQLTGFTNLVNRFVARGVLTQNEAQPLLDFADCLLLLYS